MPARVAIGSAVPRTVEALARFRMSPSPEVVVREPTPTGMSGQAKETNPATLTLPLLIVCRPRVGTSLRSGACLGAVQQTP